jgi:hypothetical protein
MINYCNVHYCRSFSGKFDIVLLRQKWPLSATLLPVPFSPADALALLVEVPDSQDDHGGVAEVDYQDGEVEPHLPANGPLLLGGPSHQQDDRQQYLAAMMRIHNILVGVDLDPDPRIHASTSGSGSRSGSASCYFRH